MMRKIVLLMLALTGARMVRAEDAAPPDATLPIALSNEGDWSGAALEFRRLALAAENPAHRGALFWNAAYAYVRDDRVEQAEHMLDRAEDSDPSLGRAALLLRAETAAYRGAADEQAFYLESLLTGSTGSDEARYAARRLASLMTVGQDPNGALDVLRLHAPDESAAIRAVERYRDGPRKKPWVGGLLGLVPGLGHAYSGEYANGVRALLINGLFIYGMVDSADRDNWGAFAAIGFFELTWYTGSIYGGVDAAHRYNRRQLDACLADVQGEAAYAPVPAALPLLQIRFSF